MYCEICGRRIFGKPTLVRVRGATLQACAECSKGKVEVRSRRSAPSIPKPQPIARPPQVAAEPKPQTRREEPELSLRPKQDYGRTIHRARESKAMTVEQFSRLVGIRESLIRKIEAEKIVPSISDLKKIERLLGVRLVEEYSEEEAAHVPAKRPSLTLGEAAELRRTKENDEG